MQEHMGNINRVMQALKKNQKESLEIKNCNRILKCHI